MAPVKRKTVASADNVGSPVKPSVPEVVSMPPTQSQNRGSVSVGPTDANKSTPKTSFVIRAVLLLLCAVAVIATVGYAIPRAYTIRMLPIDIYGPVIHEFDPWFNFRATQYLAANGWRRFFKWYDKMVWYPLGRPVGTTIYPGMQFTAVGLFHGLNRLGVAAGETLPSFGFTPETTARVVKALTWSLNDVCAYSPAWFGAVATALGGLLAYEASGSVFAGCASSIILAIIPAHLMRSMAGSFDNECMAISAMLLVFYLWTRALRSPASWPFGAAAGVAYGYMAAVWGGYVFTLNMVAIHAAVVGAIDWLVLGQWREGLFRAYALFFVIGTVLATRVPVIGMAPLQSLEQVSAVLVFAVLVTLKLAQRATPQGTPVRSAAATAVRVRYLAMLVVGALGLAAALAPTGYFGPLSARVRGLFVRHTRTGNPLVDSVAEHRPANADAIQHYLWHFYAAAHVGAAILMLRCGRWQQSTFLLTYAAAARYFMLKMSRLLLLAGPITAVLGGVAIGVPLQMAVSELVGALLGAVGLCHVSDSQLPSSVVEKVARVTKRPASDITRAFAVVRVALAALFLVWLRQQAPLWEEFNVLSERIAEGMSSPKIMFRTRTHDGRAVIVDDYYKSYLWLKQHTPKDARVMAWWDYGYQITGIGERTSIADGNTWNHEHIATLGKILTSPVKRAHSYARHLADYVLVWAGGSGDDIGKSIHPARIAHSVYRDHCGDDPTCRVFGQTQQGPMPRLEKSLLYRLVKYPDDGVAVNQNLFKLVHTSKYGKVKIYQVMNISQESKTWVADPVNRVCDQSGWYCPGQYPPAEELQSLLRTRRHFGQVEDFNRKEKDEKYHAEYMRRMGGQ